MHGRFPHLSAFGKKFLEICGAGLASAVVACLLGQTDKPAAPLSPVVYLSPADAQMIKLMHNEEAVLLERLRSQPQTPPPVAAVDTPAAQPAIAPTPTPPKSASAAPGRRELKPDRALAASAGKPPQVAVASSILPPPQRIEPQNLEPQNLEAQNLPVPAVVADAADWVSTLKQIPGWFWPAGGGLSIAAPRPPLPVGNLLQHMM